MKKHGPLRHIFARCKVKSSSPTPKGLARALEPPHDDTQDVLHGVTVKDPFRPLENLKAKETADWVARQNKRFDDYIAPMKPAEEEVMKFFAGATPKGMRETMPEKYGDKYVVERREEGQKRPSYFIKDVPDYGAPAKLLLDPQQIDPSGKTAVKFVSLTDDGKTMAYALSVSGQDKASLHFMDVATGKDLDLVYNNFQTNVNKTVKWNHDGSSFYYCATDEATKSSELRYHKMGTPQEQDKLVYAPKQAECGGEFYMLSDEKGNPGKYEYVAKYKAINVDETDKVALLVRARGSDDEWREIFPMKEGLLKPVAEVNGRTLMWTNYGAPNAKLVSVDMNEPSPDKWQTVLPESGKDPLRDVFVWQDKIFATYSHNSGQELRVFDLSGKHLHDAPISPLSTFTIGKVSKDDPVVPISFGSLQEAPSVYNYNSADNTMALAKKTLVPIDLKDCIVEQIEATSKDGTKVPLTIVRGKDTKLDGTAATLLYGYGGFNISLEPDFNNSIAQWVRAGGIYVKAHLRGGGEFGQDWYDGGRQANKQHVFDDFIAAAECLIDKKYTTNKRLAIEGGSNGGLLTLATILQRPHLFGAVVSSVPVADMFRFHIGSFEGFSWKSDYGDPDVKKDFDVSRKYSPLHNVKKGFKHPPLLIKTDIHDDRVLPWHSLKMAATLLSFEDPSSQTFLKVKTDGGHSAGMTEAQRFADIATVRAFLVKNLGPIDQNEYKAQLAKDNAAKAKPAGRKHK
jgi:prolyl oligopeptidase